MFLMAQDSEAMMVNYIEYKDDQLHRNPLFLRAVQDLEVDDVAQLLAELYNTKFRHGEDDTLVWTPSPQKPFQVKSYYNTLLGGADFPWKSTLKICIPPEVAFISQGVLRRTLTADNFKR